MHNRFVQQETEEAIRACGEIRIDRVAALSPVVQRPDGKWEPVTEDDPRFKEARCVLMYGITNIRAGNGAGETYYG